MNKILVTGGAGFIGSVISDILSENKNNEVHIIDNLTGGSKDDFFIELIGKSNVTFYELDLTDNDTFLKIDGEYDQIYHLAAIVGVGKVMKYPLKTLEVNTLSTLYLLDFVKKMKKKPVILFTSSCENYAGSIILGLIDMPTGENVPFCIDDVFNPRWTYACSKILGELAFIHFGSEHDFNVKIVRFHNVYGPRMGYKHVIPEFCQRVINKNNPFLMYGGDQYRTFCYVTDAAKMTINVMEKSNGVIYNIGSENQEILIKDIATSLFDIAGFFPDVVDEGAPKGSVSRRKPDMSKLKKESLFVNEITFKDGLRKTYEWYKKYI
jgi:nucleoside-diphosphate-sugar epimerase